MYVGQRLNSQLLEGLTFKSVILGAHATCKSLVLHEKLKRQNIVKKRRNKQ